MEADGKLLDLPTVVSISIDVNGYYNGPRPVPRISDQFDFPCRTEIQYHGDKMQLLSSPLQLYFRADGVPMDEERCNAAVNNSDTESPHSSYNLPLLVLKFASLLLDSYTDFTIADIPHVKQYFLLVE